ncbi:N-acetylmuramic acid 6-phosphate etherase [Candidatus Poribacteria bacterium]|nr:MAG: N-acetylmuramic acid 6-phosphate etherase [Candidatus Poribacteria bacterium]
MRIKLLITEQQNSISINIDIKTIPEIVNIFNQEDKVAIDAVASESDAIVMAIEMIVEAFNNKGRLFYIGAGTSGRLGVLDASECPPTFSTDPDMVQGIIAGGDKALRKSIEGAEDKSENGANTLREFNISSNDVIIGIAASGRTPFVLGALKEAYSLKAKTILLSCVPPTDDLKEYVNHFITPIVGPEIITGSTRLKAGTATKLILNMLTTISMVKIGKVYNNLMVDVQASNSKLIQRSIRIVQSITGVDLQVAQETLELAEGSAKTAIVMIDKGINRADAINLLDKHNGFLRTILT